MNSAEQIRRLEAIIDHITDVSVYPQSVRGTENDYEKRTEWMDGWNAATAEMIRRYEESTRPGWEPEPEE